MRRSRSWILVPLAAYGAVGLVKRGCWKPPSMLQAYYAAYYADKKKVGNESVLVYRIQARFIVLLYFHALK